MVAWAKVTLPYALRIANMGYEVVGEQLASLKIGLHIVAGSVVYEDIIVPFGWEKAFSRQCILHVNATSLSTSHRLEILLINCCDSLIIWGSYKAWCGSCVALAIAKVDARIGRLRIE